MMSGEKHTPVCSYDCEKHERIDEEEDDDLTLEEEMNFQDVGSDPVRDSAYFWLSTSTTLDSDL